MAIALETQEKAKAIILAGLRAQAHGSVRFCDIHATVRLNALDEEFLDVLVIYEGPREEMNIRQLNALHGEIEPQLTEAGRNCKFPPWAIPTRSHTTRCCPIWQRLARGTGKADALARPHRNRSLADHCATPNTQPLQDSLRRAVSTAYYAMFHALASSNADCLVGYASRPFD